ncbi:WD40 repeat-containing protein [Phytophthora cinnamomi]|uniref:WD40 repeat-containing protein n=1 Tax=Phytophthora cinnamomi TaxID=4785 RepID=UPI003559D9E5|nr:WD40 repeat-containing protein [Phytophthora cinnamomi]
MTDQVDADVPAPAAPVNVLLGKPTLLARVVAFVGSVDTRLLVCLNRNWAREMMKPSVWEISAGVPYEPLLINCFRRAANYCYREVDAPSPNVNRRGSPPAIRACLLNERTSMREYVHDLKLMTAENEWFDKPPRTLSLDDVPELRNEVHKNPRTAFENVGLLNNRFSRSQDARLVSGAIDQERANFYLWSLEKQHLRASMTQTNASCYDVCDEALAVGCTDGAVKIWSFSSLESRNLDTTSLVNASPTTSISHRSSLGMVPFIRTRAKDKVVNVRIDHNDGTFLHLATSTEKGEANVWDVTKGEIIVSIPSSKIHKSMLPRSQRETCPQITTLMLLRNTLVCGTSCGLIRVFDLRSSRLTHRLAGHPGAVVNADTKGRVLWSAGNEGTVRWWGGKSAKILSKSALCEGSISALEMDETVVVGGYSEQGMEAWDVRTQQSLCTFSNREHGGIKSLQFDNRKLVSVSSTGKAAMWRWYEPNPVRWFEPPTPSARFISTKFNDRHLVFGTDNGQLVDYDRLATVL